MVKILNNYPKVSFIIVNYNGISHLEQCFNTLNKLNYPKNKLEFIMIDNGSYDNSVSFVEQNYRDVKIIKNEVNEGFAKPNNDGAKIASGDYIALINNDMKIDENWLNDMFETLANCKDESYVCIGSRILNWDGTKLDFAGGSVSFYGHGYQPDFGMNIEAANEKYNKDRDILFACGGAMLIKKSVYLEVGGFDEDYFAYFEDVDLGWRLWSLGYKTRFCCKSICYHKHNSTSKKLNKNEVFNMYFRNGLFTIFKNYEDDKVYEILFASLALKTYNLAEEDYQIESRAIREFVDKLDKFKIKRDFIQSNRKVKDEFIIENFIKDPYNIQIPKYGFKNNLYNSILEKIIDNSELKNIFGKNRKKVLVISSGSIGEKMAGPGIRYLEISKELSEICEVSLAVPNEDCNLNLSDYNIKLLNYNIYDYKMLELEFLNSDIVLIQGVIFNQFPIFKKYSEDRILVVDLYDPIVIEDLEIYKKKDIEKRNNIHKHSLDILTTQVKLGDYFLCASEKQKDFWSGMLVSFNKINPREYDLSSSLEKLIGFLPFGISNEDPVHNREALKEKIPNLNKDDKVLIWGGGIWNWFDPLTVIRAIGSISKYRNDIKLFFLGVKHPNPDVPEMEMLNEAVALSEKLGIRNKNVFFNMDWVDYNDRHNFLMESYAGVCAHFDNLETKYSFRTRILDCLWANLPIITTEGDYFASEVQSKRLGMVVKYEDAEDMEKAIIKICDDKVYFEQCIENIKSYREELKWKNVTKDLKKFCLNPIKKQNEKSDVTGILDICQLEGDKVLEPIYSKHFVRQDFSCRYPNLNQIEFRIGTFAGKCKGTIKFKLFDKITNISILEETIFAAALKDSDWYSVKFKPIINSEGRDFYFTIEATDNIDKGNPFAVFYSSSVNENGTLYLDDKFIDGNLAFKTFCIITDKRLTEKDGILLFDNKKVFSLVNSMKDIPIESKNKILAAVKEVEKYEEDYNKEAINALNKSVMEIERKLQHLNRWENVVESRFKKISKFNIFRAFRGNDKK